MAQDLRDQLILPGGASSLRFVEVARRPAAVMLAEGEVPPPASFQEATVNGVRPLSYIEAASIIDQEDARRVLPKVPLDAADTMRTRHHAIARMLAVGHTHADVARTIGTTAATINVLLRSPPFQALLLEYMAMMDKDAIDSRKKLEILNSFSLDELINRVASPGQAEKLKAAELLEMVKISSDRTGLGPTSKTVSLNGRITPADIRALKNAPPLLEAQAGEWVEGSATDPSAELCGDGGEGEQIQEAGESAGSVRSNVVATDDDLSDLIASVDALLG